MKHRIMLDGMLVGCKLELISEELPKMRELLITSGAEYKGPELLLTIKAGSGMVVGLRENIHKRGDYYLNISGNPLTFLTGSNLYGSPEAGELIVKACLKCLKILGKVGEVPKRIKDLVVSKNINLYALEFATYTIRLENKQQLLNDWSHIYNSAYTSKNGLIHETVQDLLNIKMERKHKKHKSSVCFKILSSNGVNEEAMLQIYDKASQTRSVDLEVPEDIENRLRLDLNLSYTWFANRRIGGQRLKTLADLERYIEKRFDSSYTTFLSAQFGWALDRTKLFKLWDLERSCLRSGTLAERSLYMARRSLPITDESRIQQLESNFKSIEKDLQTDRRHCISLAIGEAE